MCQEVDDGEEPQNKAATAALPPPSGPRKPVSTVLAAPIRLINSPNPNSAAAETINTPGGTITDLELSACSESH
jgi:hypothetical protein